jgi:glycosyltransferase involved in cell wall biosynthesis
MPRPHVVYWNSQPSPYVVERFNTIVETGNLNFEAWFDKERDTDRSWNVDPSKWNFRGLYLPKARIGRLVVPFPDKKLLEQCPDVLITPMDRMAGALGALVGKAISRRVVSRTLPVFETWVRPTFRSESANHFLYRAIDGAKTSGEDASAMANRYGLPSDRTWKVTQSINLSLYSQALTMSQEECDKRRRFLGLHGCTFIYVGRLDKNKGLEYLIRSFQTLEGEGLDVYLLIVGDGPHEDQIKKMASNLKNVFFTGFVQASELPPWYAISNVFVFPTLGDPNGVVVEEAMAAGLPVISTSNAGDITMRIRDGENGFIVPPFDAVSLGDRMRIMALDRSLRMVMRDSAIVSSKSYSMNRYASDFERLISGVLDKPPRTGIYPLAARALGKALIDIARPL